jgi:hypothetical protein
MIFFATLKSNLQKRKTPNNSSKIYHITKRKLAIPKSSYHPCDDFHQKKKNGVITNHENKTWT